ncbi:MAG TPA: DsbA family protein [Candidatus Sulfotelmatobacter sp.]|nr:DsbA family protein [Candidatus Sulfotelmatobacter sp.]
MAKKAETSSKSLTLTLKKPNFKNLRISLTQVLVFLLIVASFLIGVLLTLVLQKNQVGTQAQAPTAQQAAPQQGLSDGQKVNVGPGHFPALGKSDAKVTIVEFADFRCPFCENFFTQTEPQIIKDYVDTGKAKFYFRQFAFLGDASVVAANAAECANDQGKFWDFHDYLYKNQPPESDTTMYNTDTLTQAATNLGMNGDQFRTCLSTKKFDSNASKDMSEGQTAGVSGTPTLFINGIAVVGAQPYSAFKTLIDQELAKAK